MNNIRRLFWIIPLLFSLISNCFYSVEKYKIIVHDECNKTAIERVFGISEGDARRFVGSRKCDDGVELELGRMKENIETVCKYSPLIMKDKLSVSVEERNKFNDSMKYVKRWVAGYDQWKRDKLGVYGEVCPCKFGQV